MQIATVWETWQGRRVPFRLGLLVGVVYGTLFEGDLT